MLRNRCPQCGQTHLFVEPNAYKLRSTAHMHKGCAACGEDFEREPGFYFGAAYVSYALTVALWVAVLVAMMAFDAWGWMEFGMFTHPGTYLTTGCTLAVGVDAGDLQVEPFHLDFDVHENTGMKKRDPHV